MGNAVEIKVYPPELNLSDCKTMKPARIFWTSSNTNVSLDSAKSFLRNMIKAIEIAEEMNKQECTGPILKN